MVPKLAASAPKATQNSSAKAKAPSTKRKAPTTAEGAVKRQRKSDAPKGARVRATPVMNGEGFGSQVFNVYVGDERRLVAVHQRELDKSPKLEAMRTKAMKSKRLSDRTTLTLPGQDPTAFNYMLEYLYKDAYTLPTDMSIEAEALILQEMFSLANHFQLPGLAKQTMFKADYSKLEQRMTFAQFFVWSEDMFHEETDHTTGIFSKFFKAKAPARLLNMNAGQLPTILRMIGLGGAFAQTIFNMYLEALMPEGLPLKEESQD